MAYILGSMWRVGISYASWMLILLSATYYCFFSLIYKFNKNYEERLEEQKFSRLANTNTNESHTSTSSSHSNSNSNSKINAKNKRKIPKFFGLHKSNPKTISSSSLAGIHTLSSSSLTKIEKTRVIKAELRSNLLLFSSLAGFLNTLNPLFSIIFSLSPIIISLSFSSWILPIICAITTKNRKSISKTFLSRWTILLYINTFAIATYLSSLSHVTSNKCVYPATSTEASDRKNCFIYELLPAALVLSMITLFIQLIIIALLVYLRAALPKDTQISPLVLLRQLPSSKFYISPSSSSSPSFIQNRVDMVTVKSELPEVSLKYLETGQSGIKIEPVPLARTESITSFLNPQVFSPSTNQ